MNGESKRTETRPTLACALDVEENLRKGSRRRMRGVDLEKVCCIPTTVDYSEDGMIRNGRAEGNIQVLLRVITIGRNTCVVILPRDKYHFVTDCRDTNDAQTRNIISAT